VAEGRVPPGHAVVDDRVAMEDPASSRQRSDGPQADPIEIVAYDPAWPGVFAALGDELRGALGEIALRIDHIGSTAVPGLGLSALARLDAGKPEVVRARTGVGAVSGDDVADTLGRAVLRI
jgi:hypothetical protein